MQIKPIPPNTANGIVALMAPYAPGLTAVNLLNALRCFEPERNDDLPTYVDKHKAAAALGVSWHTVVRMCKGGEIRACKVRGQWRIPADVIREMAGSPVSA